MRETSVSTDERDSKRRLPFGEALLHFEWMIALNDPGLLFVRVEEEPGLMVTVSLGVRLIVQFRLRRVLAISCHQELLVRA
jgi:hypothetical protein